MIMLCYIATIPALTLWPRPTTISQGLLPGGLYGASAPRPGLPSSAAAGGVRGRDITALAAIRRPSWGSRSGSVDALLAGGGGSIRVCLCSSVCVFLHVGGVQLLVLEKPRLRRGAGVCAVARTIMFPTADVNDT
jgi:hypothetical protein